MNRFEHRYCEDCMKVHYVEVLRWEAGLPITKCHGAGFIPVVNNSTHYTRHKHRGFEIVLKAKHLPRTKRLAPKKNKTKLPDLRPMSIPLFFERNCVAEISMSFRGQFVTFKVFTDATPDKFYEIFSEVGNKPTMIKTRNLGTGQPVHIQDLPSFFHIESQTKLVYHNRQAYEKLLAFDPDSVAAILEKDRQVVAALAAGR